MKAFETVWRAKAGKIEEILTKSLPQAVQKPYLLHESMRYSTLGGGKRLRALLVMGACKAVAGDVGRTYGLAAALEMIHAYSLVHDDLPCMDDDDLRRGKPANHKVYGEAVAVLAGDALLTEAFAELAKMPEKYGVPPPIALRVIAEVASSCGSRGMVGGQVVDILSQGERPDLAVLEYIHAHKTGALISAALRGGAIVGEGKEEQIKAITAYARNFGLAFQITDDILDEMGDPDLLGKKVGSDRRLEKQTYPRLFGLERSKKMAKTYVNQCLQALEGFSEDAWLLRELALFLLRMDY